MKTRRSPDRLGSLTVILTGLTLTGITFDAHALAQEADAHAAGAGAAVCSVSGGENGTPALLNPSGVVGTIGAPFNYTVSGTNDPTGYTATGLPEGLSLKVVEGAEYNGTKWVHFNVGQIKGTLKGPPGTFTAKISATNAKGTTTAPFVVEVFPAVTKSKFYTTFKDPKGVWWFKDPNGKLMISKAMDGLAGGPVPMSGQGPSDTALVLADNFNTVGAWSTYDYARIPGSTARMANTTVVQFGISYAFPVNSPVSQAMQFPDLWAPNWVSYCQDLAKNTCAQYASDPWTLGWFSDNELYWGYEWEPAGGSNSGSTAQTQLLLRFLGAPGDFVSRAQAVTFLHNKYGNDAAGLAALNKSWLTAFTDWAQVGGSPSSLTTMANRPGIGCYNDCNEFAGIVAERYFSTTTAAIKAADPNHLILGCRFASQSHPLPAVVTVEAKYVDVVSFNCYARDPSSEVQYYTVGSGISKPVLIGEFAFSSIKTNTSGDNTPLSAIDEPTQAARASDYATYIQTGMANKNLIGYSWFYVQDNPPGNGSNYGITDIHNVPYLELNKQMGISNAQAETLHAAATH